ncbi:MFS transporter [Streptomyces sp. NBC_00649]
MNDLTNPLRMMILAKAPISDRPTPLQGVAHRPGRPPHTPFDRCERDDRPAGLDRPGFPQHPPQRASAAGTDPRICGVLRGFLRHDTYVIISEIFPTHIRGVAASIATFALWGGNYLVSQFFPMLVEGIGSSSTFFIFSGISLLALLFAVALVPETKNRSLDEIERRLYGNRHPVDMDRAAMTV